MTGLGFLGVTFLGVTILALGLADTIGFLFGSHTTPPVRAQEV